MAAINDLESKKISSVTPIYGAGTNKTSTDKKNLDQSNSRRNDFVNKIDVQYEMGKHEGVQLDNMGNETEDDSAEVDIRYVAGKVKGYGYLVGFE